MQSQEVAFICDPFKINTELSVRAIGPLTSSAVHPYHSSMNPTCLDRRQSVLVLKDGDPAQGFAEVI